MSDGVVERQAARAIVLSRNQAVLLQLIEAESGRSWILPGGGLRDGETHEQALMRELAEEVGLQAIQLGPWVWRRTAEFTFRGVRYRQQERIFLAHAEPFVFDHSGLDEVEVGIVLAHQWWRIEEIESGCVAKCQRCRSKLKTDLNWQWTVSEAPSLSHPLTTL